MRVRNYTGLDVIIKQLKPTDARETFGVMQSADGNEVDKMISKINKWKDKWNSSITRTQAQTTIDTTIGKTLLDYPLPATAILAKECNFISNTFEKVALPKVGIIGTDDKTMVRAPETIGGFSIKDTYTKQFIAHIQLLIDHGASTTETGQLI